jgi:OmpA-OmpF porin, OOP family
MAVNLVEQLRSYLTPEIIQKAASYVGESESATQKAMGGIVPTLIAAFANQASTASGAQQLARMLDSGRYDGSALNNLGSLFSGGVTTQNAVGAGKEILESVFGTKLPGVIDLLARFAGVRSGSASSLLALAVPVIMHLLGRQRATVGQSPSALASLLADQKGFLSGLLPAGLSSLMGWSDLAPSLTDVTPTPTRTTTTRETSYREPRDTYREVAREPVPVRRRSDWNWLLPLLILGGLALAALSWLVTSQRAPAPVVRETPPPAATAPVAPPVQTTPPAAPVARSTDVQLPGGERISVPEGGFAHSLAQWLAGTDTAVPKRFVFDNLNFDTGTTQLTPDSNATVTLLVSVMKAYPSAAVRLEGYTDNTGDPAANKKLSLDRANAIKDLMVQGGVAATRVSTDGFGEEKPIASNDTEEGRAKNRRTELVVEKR